MTEVDTAIEVDTVTVEDTKIVEDIKTAGEDTKIAAEEIINAGIDQDLLGVMEAHVEIGFESHVSLRRSIYCV